jgi:hypothetical protein
MNRRIVLLTVMTALLLAGLSAYAQSTAYDSAKVVSVMRTNVRLIGEARKAAAAKNYFAAGESLMELARGMHSIREMAPPKGEAARWRKTIDDVVAAAFTGIGAAGVRDDAALAASIAELGRLGGVGHGIFR